MKRRPPRAAASAAAPSYGKHIGWALSVIECLAKHGPSSAEALAEHLGTSTRTIARFMPVLAKCAPIYIHKVPGGQQQWALDVDKYIARLRR